MGFNWTKRNLNQRLTVREKYCKSAVEKKLLDEIMFKCTRKALHNLKTTPGVYEYVHSFSLDNIHKIESLFIRTNENKRKDQNNKRLNTPENT